MQLDWPQSATSRESMRAVWKLLRLPVNISIFHFHLPSISLCNPRCNSLVVSYEMFDAEPYNAAR